MPLYEYVCESCGRTLEVIQAFSEPPLTTCERCNGTLKKRLSAPAVQFKGTGWYVSDYKKGSASNAARSESKGESTESASKEKASDTTPKETKKD